MAVAFVKRAAGQTAQNVTTLTATLTSAPTAGNLLVFQMSGDKNCGALTLAGFTQVYELLSASVSLYMYYKVATGSETSVSPTWATNSAAGNTYHYGEYQDAAVSGNVWAIAGQASNITNESTVSSVSTGTTGTLTHDGLAIAQAVIDNAQNAPDGTTVWSNSFTSRYGSLIGAGNRAGIYVAEKSVTAGTTTSSTFSYTPGTNDQLSGAIAVFTKVSADVTVESRGTAAAHGHALVAYGLTPHAGTSAGAHGSAQYAQTIRAGTYATAAAQGRAAVIPNVIVAASCHAAAYVRAPLVAGPNDVTRLVRATAGAHGRAQVSQTLPAPVPAGRTYRITAPRRVYEISGGVGVGLSKTFLTDESDDLDYRYDWTRVLEDGETIVTSVVEPPAAITAHDQVNGAETTDVWFTGGTPGVNYLIPNRIVTSAGRTYERNIELKVRDR